MRTEEEVMTLLTPEQKKRFYWRNKYMRMNYEGTLDYELKRKAIIAAMPASRRNNYYWRNKAMYGEKVIEKMEDNTLVGISKTTRDKAKIHVVKYKHKYACVTDLVTQAVAQQIEDDDHDADTTTTK